MVELRVKNTKPKNKFHFELLTRWINFELLTRKMNLDLGLQALDISLLK